jgi:hypothetical protein
MSWTAIFFIAGILFVAAWAYHAIRDYRNQRVPQENTPVTSLNHRTSKDDITNLSPPDVFDENRIKKDLARLAATPGALGKYIAQAQIRFTHARQIQVLNRWTEFYNAGEAVIRARTQLARAHSDLQQVDIEGEVKLKEKDARIAELEAQIAESELRKAEARQRASQLIKEKTTQPALTREQERILKKTEIEGNIARLRDQKTRALSAIDPFDEDSIMRAENMYDDRIAREEEQLSKYL